MLKRKSQSAGSEENRSWYLDKYQHVLVQRNVLALITLVAIAAAVIATTTVYSLAPLKTVEPYLLKIDEKSGIVQKVEPITRNQYAANDAVDRYFVSKYIMSRESYNPSIVRYNNNVVRVMSAPDVFYIYRGLVDPANDESPAAKLRNFGVRDVRFKSVNYIQNPPLRGNEERTPTKIMQARFTTTDRMPNNPDAVVHWVATVSFEYAALKLNEEEQLINPIGFTVTTYQIQKEIN